MSSILEQLGARKTSQAVHRPLTLSLRHKQRRESQRFRSQAGQQRRNEKKALKGFGPLANKRPHSAGRSSGSRAKHGRSSGSSEQPQWWQQQWQAGAWEPQQWTGADWRAWQEGRWQPWSWQQHRWW